MTQALVSNLFIWYKLPPGSTQKLHYSFTIYVITIGMILTPIYLSSILQLNSHDHISSHLISCKTIQKFGEMGGTTSMASTVRSKTIIFSENLWCSTPSLAIRRRKEKLLNWALISFNLDFAIASSLRARRAFDLRIKYALKVVWIKYAASWGDNSFFLPLWFWTAPNLFANAFIIKQIS